MGLWCEAVVPFPVVPEFHLSTVNSWGTTAMFFHSRHLPIHQRHVLRFHGHGTSCSHADPAQVVDATGNQTAASGASTANVSIAIDDVASKL